MRYLLLLAVLLSSSAFGQSRVVNGIVVNDRLPGAGVEVLAGVDGIDIIQIPGEYQLLADEIVIASPSLQRQLLKYKFPAKYPPASNPYFQEKLTIPFCNGELTRCTNSSEGVFVIQGLDEKGVVIGNSVIDLK